MEGTANGIFRCGKCFAGGAYHSAEHLHQQKENSGTQPGICEGILLEPLSCIYFARCQGLGLYGSLASGAAGDLEENQGGTQGTGKETAGVLGNLGYLSRYFPKKRC